MKEKLEDIKEITRNRKSKKDRQYNSQMKKEKKKGQTIIHNAFCQYSRTVRLKVLQNIRLLVFSNKMKITSKISFISYFDHCVVSPTSIEGL